MQPQFRPVDVIAMYSADGSIRPRRVRVEDNDLQCYRVDIDEILKTTDIPYVGAEATLFYCRGSIEGRSKTFALKYRFSTHSWYLLEGRIQI